MIDPESPVADSEELFRGVAREKEEYYSVDPDSGNIVPTKLAFLDPAKEISVDRAVLNGGDPSKTQVQPTDLVFGLPAGPVRATKIPSADPAVLCDVNVRPDPLDKNPAHAVIYVDTELVVNRRMFSKLKEALVQLAVCRLS